MDDLKQKILSLIERDRYRPRKHFLESCRKRNATIEDALKVLKNGFQVKEKTEIEPEVGESWYFQGRDTKDRKMGVVVYIDQAEDMLWLKTIINL